MSCEIVDNVACGQTFQYCRTHKVEPKDCLGSGPTLASTVADDISKAYKSHVNARPKREFRAGDKVRCLVDNDPGKQFTKGKIYTVRSAYGNIVNVASDDKGSPHNGWIKGVFEVVE